MALLPAKLLIRAGLKKAFFDDAKITPDMVEAYAAPLAAPGGKAALRKAGTMLFPPDLAALGTRYPEIAAPTLLLWGRQDELIGLGDGQKLEAALPNAALEIVEAAATSRTRRGRRWVPRSPPSSPPPRCSVPAFGGAD